MSKFFSDANLTPEEFAAAEAMVGFKLAIPTGATRNAKGYASWTETGVIDKAIRKDVVGQNGAQRVEFLAVVKIVPVGIDSPNVGKQKWESMLVNYGALKGVAGSAGTGSIDNEKFMSARSLKKLKQLAAVVKLDLSGGLSPAILDAMFPEEGGKTSVLLGTKVAVIMSDSPSDSLQYGNNQNVDSFLRMEV